MRERGQVGQGQSPWENQLEKSGRVGQSEGREWEGRREGVWVGQHKKQLEESGGSGGREWEGRWEGVRVGPQKNQLEKSGRFGQSEGRELEA